MKEKIAIKFAYPVIFLFVFFSLVSGPLVFCQEPSSKEEEMLFVAKKAFEDGFYEVSIGLLERFLKNYPSSAKAAEAKLLIGESLFHQNRFLDALAKFEQLKDDPSAKGQRDACLFWIAEVYFKGNSFRQAADYYKMVLDSYPNSAYAHLAAYSLGWCWFQEKDFKQALVYFDLVQEKYPKEPQAQDAFFKAAESLYNLKDYAGIKKRLSSSLRDYAKDPARLCFLYFYLGEADYYLDNFSQAAQSYRHSSEIAVDEKIKNLAIIGESWAYLKLKRYKEAEDLISLVRQDKLDQRTLQAFLLARAILMADTNRVHEARSLYEGLISLAGEPLIKAQAYIGKADALYNLAEYDGAVSVYREALIATEKEKLPAEFADKLHYGLAWALLKQGEFREAIQEFQKVASVSQDKIAKVSALCQIGDAYQDSGDYPKALEAYGAILRDYPDSFWGDYVQYQSGLTQLKSMNYDAAVLSFLALKKNYPQSKLLDDASYALGLAYFQKQDYVMSRDVLGKFQDEFRDSILRADALYLLASSLFNLGRFQEAQDIFRNIARLYSHNKELLQKAEYEVADCSYQMGNENEALNRFKALRAKYPDASLTPEIMWWIGEYYYRHNDLELARRYFLSLIQDFPKSSLIADAYYAIGSTYQIEEKNDEALANFNKVLKQGKSDIASQAAVAIADIYCRQKDLDQALKSYKEILTQYPNLAATIYPKMADIYAQLSEYPQALDYLRKSLDIVPLRQMPQVQFRIAETLQAEGSLESAIEEYLKVTYLYSDDSNLGTKALLRTAAIYEGKERFREALNIYQKIVVENIDESKYAKERIAWIEKNTK